MTSLFVGRVSRVISAGIYEVISASTKKVFVGDFNGIPGSDLEFGDCVRVEVKVLAQEGRIRPLKSPQVVLPTDPNSVTVYLARGMNPPPASVVETYGYLESTEESVIDSMNESRIPTVPALDPEIWKDVQEYWLDRYTFRQFRLLGLTDTEAREAHDGLDQTYSVVYSMLTSNPYLVYTVDINKADRVFARLGKVPTGTSRKCGEIVRWLHTRLKSGDISVSLEALFSRFSDLGSHLNHLRQEYPVVVFNEHFYLYAKSNEEQYIAEYLSRLVKGVVPRPIRVTKLFGSITLSDKQREAVVGCLNSRLAVITGRPGSGKSECIGQIYAQVTGLGMRCQLTSFTGKAVSRLREVIKKDTPATMHMLMAKHVDPFDYLIIDEASMVTTSLLYEFLGHYPHEFTLILVGDPDQLPPVEAGALFYSVLTSKSVRIYRLEYNYRVKAARDTDGIIATSLAMLSQGTAWTPKSYPNVSFIEGGISEVIACAKVFHDGGINYRKIQVIAPYNKDVSSLNSSLQTMFNPRATGRGWFPGDRVMMTENLYKHSIFNGMEGEVVATSFSGVKVKFPPGEVSFLFKPRRGEPGVRLLVLSYAITAHRSQGCQWDTVFVLVAKDDLSFVNSNLIYTACTRAESRLVVVGDLPTIQAALGRRAGLRGTQIGKRIDEIIST